MTHSTKKAATRFASSSAAVKARSWTHCPPASYFFLSGGAEGKVGKDIGRPVSCTGLCGLRRQWPHFSRDQLNVQAVFLSFSDLPSPTIYGVMYLFLPTGLIRGSLLRYSDIEPTCFSSQFGAAGIRFWREGEGWWDSSVTSWYFIVYTINLIAYFN